VTRLRVKLSLGGVHEVPSLSQFIGSAPLLNEVDLRVNDPECLDADVWLIIEQPNAGDTFCRVPRGRVVYLGAETSFSSEYWNRYRNRRQYLQQFAAVYSWLPIRHPGLKRSIPFLPWMVNANHGESIFSQHSRDAEWLATSNPLKTKCVSVFCSSKTFTPGHKRRLEFVELLASELGDQLDWFGNGVRSVPEKWDGLAPYRYTVVLENQSMPDLITEKLYDAFLASSFPIYWGAPNVLDWFPAGSLAPVSLDSPKAAVEEIRRIISSDVDAESIEARRQARHMVLNDYNFARRVAALAMQLGQDPVGAYDDVHITPLEPDPAYAQALSRAKHSTKTLVRRATKQ
jgi:hypothetical protein